VRRRSGASDFDWPPVPYSQFLRQQVAAQTEYEYLNPQLDRRYDPVVVTGNAMHPVIQRGDVILIDTGNKQTEDGRAVAVSVGGGRTVIGYWRDHNGTPVLEQECTTKVVDLSEYPGWSIYGVVTKIIGRGIPPHTPVVGSPLEEARMNVTPGQAQYVVERLIKERRVSQAEVDGYVRDMEHEIEDIEQRLADLRAASGHARVTASAVRSAVQAPKTRKRSAGGKKGHPRGIAGTLAVLLRAIPAAEHAAIQAIRADKGIKAAIRAARAAANKV
jgi:Peptidase S24-like